ncbi:MAG TPA: neuraminidase-like domain-containing protein [Pyrinomonadaceae bacterium]|nr:neuraminidase-like domain-containing protein [Pyrinomonadaceae bacterium]
MANLIIIRLHPLVPTSGTDFTTFLTGLTITAFDMSVNNPKTGDPIGPTPATYLPPTGFDFANRPTFDPAATIVQDYSVPTIIPPGPIVISASAPQAIATAVITVPPGRPEYVTADVRLEFNRLGETIPVRDLYYDVRIITSAPLVPAQYAAQPASIYVGLVGRIDPATARVTVPRDGTPPNFTQLQSAIQTVLAADPGGAFDLGTLTPEQSRHIAYEIVWGTQDPMPALPTPASVPAGLTALEAMYTNPPNTGDISNQLEQDRQHFEGDMNAYYSIRNADVERLAKFVFSLGAAIACQQMSQQAHSALFRFPVNPGVTGTLTTISEGEVILEGLAANPLVPAFNVPADYFYVLGANMPTQITAAQRFQVACRDDQGRVLSAFIAAVDGGVISPALLVNPAQAARILTALAVPLGSRAARCPLVPALQPMIQDWLNYPPAPPALPINWRNYNPGDDIQGFWIAEAAARPGPFLDLVLCALTENQTPLMAAIRAVPINDVATLATTTAPQWRNLFGTPPNVALLPPFTQPGTPEARVEAFIRHVRKFFDTPSGGLGASPAVAGAHPLLGLPAFDPIQAFVANYNILIGGVFTFGTPFNEASLRQAIIQVFPADESAQSWLEQVLRSLNDLCRLANVQSNVPPPVPPSLAFSVAEALYARGFTSVQDVQALTLSDFQDALRGTVAFDQAAAIYAAAGAVGPPAGPAPLPFHPVNPGLLTNCVPPCYLSPLGPVEYLHEMLLVSENSTCHVPFAGPTEDRADLAGVIAKRRGPLGDLQVTAANLQTPLPLIDIVNECLEEIAANAPAVTSGVVYNTATQKVADHKLCPEITCAESGQEEAGCHKPATLFSTMPEHSTPATPVEKPLAYDRLRSDFSSPRLPYSQPLDICRCYLLEFCTCRYEAMRTFRKEITEFVLDPTLAAPVFQSHLWRYPVRLEMAIEYLGFTPEEYDQLFNKDIPAVAAPGQLSLPELYGFEVNAVGGRDWIRIVTKVPEFLKRTGLTYCEFLEFQKAGFVSFRNANPDDQSFPDCEPCCLDEYTVFFENQDESVPSLKRLAIFIRLWRKLKEGCCGGYSFVQLRDICEVLQLFIGPAVNPDFIRQLAAFQILRDQLRLELTDRTDHLPGTGADRTHLLALWVPSARKLGWAINEMIERIEHYAVQRHKCERRGADFIKLLGENLDALSRLMGFDPNLDSDTWHKHPTSTLRFVEVLAKIYASRFGIGEIIFLFTASEHLQGDDPFPLQTANEALDDPLELPDDDREYSLWTLRRKLLSLEVNDEQAERWTWPRIEASLRSEFGYVPPGGGPDSLLSLGQHFFPRTLASYGSSVTDANRQYRVGLAGTPALMWNTPPDGPFHYDTTANELWIQLPLKDESVIERLGHLRQLTVAEQKAVQELYYLPRVDLAPLAFLFPDFAAADRHLIQEEDEAKRWRYFQRRFALAHARCRVIAAHLSEHVASVSGRECEDDNPVAWFVLRHLFADENRAKTPWENDSGHAPAVTWGPPPNGGAFAALLGLTGTGLLGEFTPADGSVLWREVRGPMDAFGHDRNINNCPVPVVLPAMGLTLSPEQSRFVTLRNSMVMDDEHGDRLGGSQGFGVRWSGVLMIEHHGSYEFRGGAPTPEADKPNFEAAEHAHWQVTLKRGQKTWIVLSHHWPDEQAIRKSCLELRRGAYQIVVEFRQPEGDFSRPENGCRQHTGFQVKYSGPDSEGKLVALPLRHLFRDTNDQTLGFGIEALSATKAGQSLDLQFSGSIRDIRRTYQRAFKAILFAHGFRLSATPVAHYAQSELGYIFAHDEQFAGISYFRNPAVFSRHAADFNFNFFPLLDNYHAPTSAQDQRVQPSAKRMQALFDWWERMFDYTRMRRESRAAREHPLWLLFLEAAENQPDNPAHLVRHMGVDLRHADLLVRYYQNQATALFEVSSDDLEDDRWAVRVWKGEKWIRRILRCFVAEDIRNAKPALWASDDLGRIVAGETETGNANLTRFVDDGRFENSEPRRYEDARRLNDCLRERGRAALLDYLCRLNRVPLPAGGSAKSAKDLSDFLLLDVETGICERASRIEEAITAVQNFVQRARLGLEPNWNMSHAFVLLWDRKFVSFKIWEACKRRELYRENWIDWDELQKAKKIEAFSFLETELRRNTLTVPVSGGLEYWPDQLPPIHPAMPFLQQRDASSIMTIPPREGLGLLGTPERDARPSWLSPVSGDRQTRGPNDIPVAVTTVAPDSSGKFPFWMEAAIRLGVRFFRVAAAGVPPASTAFEPREFRPEPGCCRECGCVHAALVDEYYFWLLDSRFFQARGEDDSKSFVTFEQDDYYDQTTQQSLHWHELADQPNLLEWKTSPMVRLGWCRVHNGEFQPPRRSHEGVLVNTGVVPDLVFVGRLADSLTFSVTGGLVPVGYLGPDLPGFRYDLATDEAVVVPLIAANTPPSGPFPAGLPAYPYFVYVEPGDRLFPNSLYSPALAVANVLRAHCRFEAALKWYELVFDPLKQDSTWIRCGQEPQIPERDPIGRGRGIVDEGAINTCCDSTKVSEAVIRNRSVLLQYLETLLAWGDALMCGNNPEAFQKARLIIDTMSRILGPSPQTVVNLNPPAVQTVAEFEALFPPLNPRLMELYCHVSDRLGLIHHCLNSRRLRNGTANLDMPYWGENPCREEWRSTTSICADDAEWCYPHSPYRFLFLVQKANEIAGHVRELGAALLSAFEKGDAEYLASLRSEYEVEMNDLILAIRQDQWREADWQRQGLQKTKEVAQTNRRYYATLIQNGLNSGELQYQDLIGVSLVTKTASNAMEAVAEVMDIIPDIFVGFPCEEVQLPVGTKLAGLFKTIARITNTLADMSSTTASLDLTQAGWLRRAQEWIHQVEVLDIEIQQIERQILAAERRRDQALRELNNQQRQGEHSRETQNFIRDRFTNHDLYLWMQKETAALYWKMYELGLHAAHQAQRAFNFERGCTHRKFLSFECWDNLREGLLVGERLQLALRRMEKEYLDLNRREYELTKHISLRRSFPMQFLRLKVTGRCEIDIPEWMFDLDYPGQYLRRIKNVTMTIPCVTGPYTGVHCRLTLLSSQTRVDPCLGYPATHCCADEKLERCRCKPASCCGEGEPSHNYETCADDPRIVRHYAAREAIATSSGQNDSGMFELNFRDERYLPFEFLGAVSRWSIELPPENNFFDVDTLSDVILHLNYTSREGGEELRRAAAKAAQQRLPGDGWSLFDIRHEFPDAWQMFQDACRFGKESPRELDIRFNRQMLPFLPGDPDLRITKLALLFETTGGEHCGKTEQCPCRSGKERACHLIEIEAYPEDENDEACECKEPRVSCIASAEWPTLYHGVFDIKVGPLQRQRRPHRLVFRFPACAGLVSRAFLFCHYEVVAACCDTGQLIHGDSHEAIAVHK